MRAFLREPSTPWIVFDREGRPPSQLAVGEVLPVALSSVLPDHGFFPATAIIDAAASADDASSAGSRAEPSSLAVASDLDDVGAPEADDADDELAPAYTLPGLGLGRRALGIAAVGLAIVSTLAVGAFALRGSEALDARAPNALAGRAARATGGASGPAEALSPSLESGSLAAAVPAQPAAPAPAAQPAPHAAPAQPASAAAPGAFEIRKLHGTANHKFSRLSIAAGSRDVFLDGRRLLGRGARSFTVTCGTHSIAVGARTDARDLEVPCNSEVLLGK